MITSTANQQIKNIMKLQKSASFRRKQGLFIVEGIRMFREIPKQWLKQVYVTEEFYQMHQELFADVSYELVSPAVYRDISDTMTPQGILAVVKRVSYSLRKVVLGQEEPTAQVEQPPLVLLLENIQDPGNLGTILRMAEGAGVTGVVLSKDTVDIFNSKVIRSTMGAIFRVPFIYVEQLEEVVSFMKEQGIVTYAAHLEGKEFYDYDYAKGTCFFIGNEGNGLTPFLTNQAEQKIRIPMQGQVESLNAATAATVLAYEAMRQRR